MVLRLLGRLLRSGARLMIRQFGLVDSGRLWICLGRAAAALFGATACARGSWNTPAREAGFQGVQVSVFDEDGSELLLIDPLIRVGGRIALACSIPETQPPGLSCWFMPQLGTRSSVRQGLVCGGSGPCCPLCCWGGVGVRVLSGLMVRPVSSLSPVVGWLSVVDGAAAVAGACA